MNELSVILAFGLPDELVTPIRDVSPRLRVVRLSGGQRRAYRSGRPIWYAYAEQRRPEKETDQEAEDNLARILAEAEVLFTSPLMPANITDRAPKLRWVQLTSAGVDRLLDGDLAKSGVTLTTASGIHAVPIGEYVMGVMLAFAKGLPQAMRAQAERTWRPYLAEELYDKTVGIVGLGAIGGYVAKLAKADGMRVLAVRRSTQRRSTGEGAGLDDVDELLPPSDLTYLLSEADYVVIAVPLTAESRGLIGERELRAMKPTARIINIARGALIDEAALVQALNEKWIGGAALDVFEHEPLPPESELWGMENVILTPHISGGTPVYMERAVELFCDNLRRYLAGEPLRNVVEVERGY
ncbi:MAG: D-2-hydroxyacid dehydrogenase [Chloroflexi bacterium]|nr:D-2-hydroxyacid dehydrogenase [Chloroflexota bacterium]